VVFDEASSWWSPQKEELSDSKEIEERLQQKIDDQIAEIRPSQEDLDNGSSDDNTEQETTQSPWQTGIYQQPTTETKYEGAEPATPQSHPRRSIRIQKPNSKYANATVAKEKNVKEPETF